MKSTSIIAAFAFTVLAASACGASGAVGPEQIPTGANVAAIRPAPTPGACSAEDAAAHYPGATWGPVDETGWTPEGVRSVLDAAEHGHWAAGMLIQGGRLVGRFGDIDRAYDTRSIRKAMVGAVIGQLIGEGRLSLDATLADLGIDEDVPLSPVERTATLRHLLQSRSGVYRPAAFATPSEQATMPAPGSHQPGASYWYNNWGFNALGTIVRNATGQTIGALIQERIATPLGMQDFSPANVRDYRVEESRHGAYLTQMSTRDRARFGYMYLRNGCWAGQQIVPANWVAESLAPSTNRDRADDFGYTWRSSEGVTAVGMTERYYFARGNAMQYIMLIPEWDIVLVLTTDMEQGVVSNWIKRRTGLQPDLEDVTGVLLAISQARPRS